MAVKIEASSVFGIIEGSSFYSDPTDFSPDRNRYLRRALNLPQDETQVPQVASLAIISACLAYQGNRPDVQEAVRDLTGSDGVVGLYLRQTADFLGDIRAGDNLTCVLEFIKVDSTPRVNQLTATTDIYRQTGERITTGEATVRLVPLGPKVIDDQIPEKVGIFASGPAEQIKQILETRNGDCRLDNVIKSPYLYVTEEAIELFANGSLDHNSLHLNPKVAKRTLFKGRIAHGMFGIGVVLENAGGFVTKMEADFVRPVWIGDIIGSEVNMASTDNHGHNTFPFAVSKITSPNLIQLPVIKGKLLFGR